MIVRRGAGVLVLCVLAGLVGRPAAAGTIEVHFAVPVRARLDLSGRSSLALAPCIVVAGEGQGAVARGDVDVQGEFESYLSRLLRRRSSLRLIKVGPVDYPTYDLEMLSRNEDFWRFLGERTGADLILTCSLDFDIQDRSGYRTEEYVSPFDGRTYYRQVLVEQTGYEYDIVMDIFDGHTGKLIYSDNFKDFKRFEGEGVDPLEGMFENLYALEDRIAGIFSVKHVETVRTLFTN